MEKTVLTSLPAERYKAKDVAELYHSRWEIEVGFRNLKSSLLNNALVLRSRKVELREQEVWSMLLAYNLIRHEATKAAEKHKKAASEISFKFAFQFIATDNDRAGKHGVTRDHPETTGASAGGYGSGVHNKTPPTIKDNGG